MTQIFSAISQGKIPAVTRVPPEDKLEIASNQPQPLTDHSILVTQSDTEAAVLTNKSKKKVNQSYDDSYTANETSIKN